MSDNGDFSTPDAFDMAAANLQAESQDVDSFFQVLANKLEGSLGSRVTIEKEGGLFNKNKDRAKVIVVHLGELALKATKGRNGVECQRTHAVRGIVLRSEELGFDAWLRELVTVLQTHAQENAAARAALESLLT